MLIETVCDFRAAMRAGKYAWPGGYPRYFITSDGECLSFEAARENLRLILDSIAYRVNDGWRVVAVDINWESYLVCAHTNEVIESAYGSDGEMYA